MLIGAVIAVGCSTPSNDDGNNNNDGTDTLAQCLTERGAVMYGTEWCGYCQKQKEMFAESFQYIKFVDCDADKEVCTAAGVTGYPTWEIDGQTYPGLKSLEQLASLAGC